MTAVFVFKLGPIGGPDSQTHLYVASNPEAEIAIADSTDDRDGLQQIAARYPGHALTCEPALSAAGAPIGYSAVEYDGSTAEMAGGVAASIALSEFLVELTDRQLLFPFLREAGAYRRRRLPSFWDSRVPIEIRLSGHVRDRPVEHQLEIAVGRDLVFLFTTAGALARFEAHMAAGRVDRANDIDRRQLTFAREPGFALPPLLRGYQLDAVPEPFVLDHGDKLRFADDDFVVTTAVLHVLARVAPDLLEQPLKLVYREPGAACDLVANVARGPAVRVGANQTE